MAKGRMINNSICMDKVVDGLSCDTSRLAFTWLITYADAEGRTYGDPAVVRSMIFPRRKDITIEQIEEYITEWNASGLVIWYEVNGDKFISFPKFDKNQKIRKDREAPSIIPPIPVNDTDALRTNSGLTPDQNRVKLKEVKLKEQKESATAIVFTAAENCWGVITNGVAGEITEFIKDTPVDWFLDAFKEAEDNNKRSWAYARAIIRRWKKEGKGSGKPAKVEIAAEVYE